MLMKRLGSSLFTMHPLFFIALICSLIHANASLFSPRTSSAQILLKSGYIDTKTAIQSEFLNHEQEALDQFMFHYKPTPGVFNELDSFLKSCNPESKFIHYVAYFTFQYSTSAKCALSALNNVDPITFTAHVEPIHKVHETATPSIAKNHFHSTLSQYMYHVNHLEQENSNALVLRIARILMEAFPSQTILPLQNVQSIPIMAQDPSAIIIQPSSASSLRIVIPEESILLSHETLEEIASIPHVIDISITPEYSTMNRYSHALMQTDSRIGGNGFPNSAFSNDTWVNMSNLYDPVNLENPPGILPLFEAGFDGTGLVAGCSDSGVDYTHCFFNDSTVPVPLNIISSTHRKFISYETLVDSADILSGHGTHVAGSILGAAVDTDVAIQNITAAYNGGASGAKLYFQDLGLAADPNAIYPPANLATGLFPNPYANSAKVHSNSWGSSANSYLTNDRDIDLFSSQNPDMLVLFAAGNAGQYGAGTVGSPANSKNALIVGAAQSTKAAFREYFLNYVSLESSGPAIIDTSFPSAAFGPTTLQAIADYPDSKIIRNLTISTPLDGCSAISNDINDSIVLIQRGTCAFVDKVKNAQNAGAIAVIIDNNVSGDSIIMGGDDSSITIPSCMVSNAQGLAFRASPEFEIVYTADAFIDLSANDAYGGDNLAYFSSQGPTADFRIKPDLIAPGDQTFSSRGTGGISGQPTCGRDAITVKHGTSMATPTTAGLLLPFRQWITNHTGTDINAATLKASILLASKEQTGIVDVFPSTLEPLPQFVPNYHYGFGRIMLKNVLDNGIFVNESSVSDSTPFQTFCFNTGASNSSRLKFLITWMDPAGALQSSVNLVNDLDLSVTINNVTYLGNSNSSKSYDTLNNVELVQFLSYPSLSNVSVTVNSRFPLQTGSQGFSLVATGDTTLTRLSSCSTACPNNCNGEGTCSPEGVCACNSLWAGADCSQPIATIQANSTIHSGTVPDFNEWVYYYLPISSGSNKPETPLEITFSSSTDPDYYISSTAPPSLGNYDFRNINYLSDVATLCYNEETDGAYENSCDWTGISGVYIGITTLYFSQDNFSISMKYEDKQEHSASDLSANDGISPGETVIIVIGVLIGVSALGFMAFRYRSSRRTHESIPHGNPDDGYHANAP